MIKQSFQKGVSLYLAIIIMAILLSMALGLSAILLSQIKILAGIENSVIAFFAADAGIERAVYALYKDRASFPFSYSGYLDLNNNGTQDEGDSSYSVEGTAPGPGCPTPPNDYYCLKSVGIYKTTRRAIEASR